MTGSLPLLSLNHISRVVKDVQASIEFYCNVLGFTMIKRPSSFHFEGAWCALAAAGRCWRDLYWTPNKMCTAPPWPPAYHLSALQALQLRHRHPLDRGHAGAKEQGAESGGRPPFLPGTLHWASLAHMLLQNCVSSGRPFARAVCCKHLPLHRAHVICLLRRSRTAFRRWRRGCGQWACGT